MTNEPRPPEGRQPDPGHDLTHTHFNPNYDIKTSSNNLVWPCSTCSSTVSADELFCPNDGTPNGDFIPAEHRHKIPNYELIRVRGAGGMGAVFEARHLALGKTVAVKMLHGHLLNERLVMRFQQEAKATSKLKHPNIISVFDCGVAPGGEPYMVMELIEGPSLKDVLVERGSLPIEDSLETVLQICDGMTCAHDHKILHRDLKPGNILLERKNHSYEVRIADFGIAKLIGDESTNQLTRTGEVFGSPQYMSPEQTNSRPVDARSDVYSIGCILYELLTGAPPFTGTSVIETMYKHVNDPIPTLTDGSLGKRFPESLEAIVAKSLAKAPQDRYSSATELSDAIRGFLSSSSQKTLPELQTSSQTASQKISSSLTKPVLLSLLLFLCLGLPAIFFFMRETKQVITVHSPNSIQMQTPAANTSRVQLQSPASDHELFETAKTETAESNTVPLDDLFDRAGTISRDTKVLVDLHSCHLRNSEASAFKNRKDIITLILRGNKELTDQSVDSFAHLPLVQLDISNTGIGNAGVAKIATSIRKLQVLDLSFLNITDDAIKQLAKLHELRSLVLDSDLQLTANCLPHLAYLESLTTLTLRNLKLKEATPDQWNSLTKLRNLQSLNLEVMPLGSSISSALPKLKSLKDLNLRDTNVDDTLVQQLGPLDLDSIDLSHTSVTNLAIKLLAKHKHLTKLELGGLNRVDSNALVALKSMPQLTTLNLESASLSEEDIIQVAALKNLEYLLLNNTKGAYHRNSIDDESVRKLAGLKQLKSLGLGFTDITDVSIVTLQNSKLEELELQGTGITDEGLEELAKMTSLRKLYIQDCRKLTKSAIQKFKNDLRSCVVTSKH